MKKSKKITFIAIFSTLILSPMALVSCVTTKSNNQIDPSAKQNTKQTSPQSAPKENNTNTNGNSIISPQNPDSSKTPETQVPPTKPEDQNKEPQSPKDPEIKDNGQKNEGPKAPEIKDMSQKDQAPQVPQKQPEDPKKPETQKPPVKSEDQNKEPQDPKAPEKQAETPKDPQVKDMANKNIQGPKVPEKQAQTPKDPEIKNMDQKDQAPQEPQKQPEASKKPETQKPPTNPESSNTQQENKQPEVQKTPEKPKAPKAEEPQNPGNTQNNANDQGQTQEDSNVQKWWQNSGAPEVELTKISSDGQNLNLSFSEELPQGITAKLVFSKTDDQSGQTKEIDFSTTKSKDQKINLGELRSGKYTISHIIFGIALFYPNSNNTFDYTSANEDFLATRDFLRNLDINVKEEKKNIQQISHIGINDFNYSLIEKESNENSKTFEFPQEILDKNKFKQAKVKFTFKSQSEQVNNSKRSVNLDVHIDDKFAFTKTIEWTYLSLQSIYNQFEKREQRYNELKDLIIKKYFENRKNTLPIELPNYKKGLGSENKELAKSTKISLKDEIDATFKGYGILKYNNSTFEENHGASLNDKEGSAKLVFEISRGNYQGILIEISINGFATYGDYDKDYESWQRENDFNISASSQHRGYSANLVFKPYWWQTYYWLASYSDQNPSLTFSFKDQNKDDLIYGFKLLFWKGQYYRSDSYKVEYRKTANGPWESLDISNRKVHEFSDNRFIEEEILIKKDQVQAVRVTFLKDKKAHHTSVAALMPITKKASSNA